jgi:hypothetical protein
MKRSEGNFLMAAKMRTNYANQIFKPAKVASFIDELAFNGFRHYRIVQEWPFDLSDTDAAKALEVWLDQEQFHYTWRPTYLAQDPLRPTVTTEYPELLITW